MICTSGQVRIGQRVTIVQDVLAGRTGIVMVAQWGTYIKFNSIYFGLILDGSRNEAYFYAIRDSFKLSSEVISLEEALLHSNRLVRTAALDGSLYRTIELKHYDRIQGWSSALNYE